MGAAYAPILFQSTDTGAAVMCGQAGALTDILNQCLIVKNVFVESEAAAAFSIGKEDGTGSLILEGTTDLILEDIVLQDKTTQARTQSTAASDDFVMFLGPTTNDRVYVGMQAKFGRMFITLGVNGSNDGVRGRVLQRFIVDGGIEPRGRHERSDSVWRDDVDAPDRLGDVVDRRHD
jgi:hypothetical protein